MLIIILCRLLSVPTGCERSLQYIGRRDVCMYVGGGGEGCVCVWGGGGQSMVLYMPE